MISRPPRIGFLSHSAENLYLFRLAWMVALESAGYEVSAIVPEGRYVKELHAQGIKVLLYDIDRGSLSPFGGFKTVLQLARMFRETRFDLVQSFTIKPNIYGAVACSLAGVPLFVPTVTGLGSVYVYAEEARKGSLRRLFGRAANLGYRVAFSRARSIVFQNPDDLAQMKGLIPCNTTTVLIPGSGVDVDFFRPSAVQAASVRRIREELHLESCLVCTMIARLIWHKGVREFAEAARMLGARQLGIKFLLVGDIDRGNPAAVSTEFIRRVQRQTPKVIFTGERRDIREILAATDIHVLPSYREGTPRTNLEAMAMGKPVITTDTPGCRQTVDDCVSGILVRSRDAVQLAAAIEKLALDPALRQSMGQAARAKVEREFSNQVVVGEVLSLYEGFFGRNRGAGEKASPPCG